jgi:ligand-binding sensor domain-containing protein
MKFAWNACLAALLALLCCCANAARLPFTYEKGPGGMFNSGVRAILQDSSGAYWFGSHFEGVCRFDGERIQCFTEADGLSNNQVRSIQEDARGVVWFDTGVGISCFAGGAITSPAARRYDATTAWKLDADDLWFKGNESHGFNQMELEAGVYRYDGSAFAYLTFPLPRERAVDDGYSITGICRGEGGRVWIATYGAVFGFDGSTLSMIDGRRMGLRKEDGDPHVRCVFEDSKGRLWIGNNGVGVFVIDDERVSRLSELCEAEAASADAAALPMRVFALGEDREGGIWIGTVGGGAWRYDGRTLRQFGEQDGLTTKDVVSIYRDPSGDLWVGGEGVFRFNGTGFDRMH